MAFTKFVQVGRVVSLTYGPHVGKLAVILDVVTLNRVLIEGPTTGVPRHVVPIRRVRLTRFHIEDVSLGQRTTLLKKRIQKFELQKKWDATVTAKRAALKAKRASLNDFDRFKVMILKKRYSERLNHGIKSARPRKGGKTEAKPAAEKKAVKK